MFKGSILLMKYLLTYLFIILTFYSKAQNLVPNYSFENYSACPSLTNNQITLAIPWTSATATCSTDYFNACSTIFNVPNYPAGYQLAKTGEAYAGLYFLQTPEYREYLQIKLDSVLKSNKCYYVEFYVNLGDGMPSAVNNISANLSINQPVGIEGVLIPLTPHILNIGNPIINDSINWVKISGYYTALGGEQYLTIGNFFNDVNTNIMGPLPNNAVAYYFVDDVTVEEVKVKQWNYANTSLCLNESVVLSPNTNDTNIYALNWMPSTALSCSSCSITTTQPQVTTTYTLTKQRCNITTTDTVRVTVKDCNPSIEIPNVFTPNGDGINDTFNFSIVGASDVSFTIFNRWGLEIQTTTLKQPTTFIWDGRITSGIECSDGVYFYSLSYKLVNGDLINKKGFITLMR
jgi:gliding motility-associated-like protein